MIDDRSVPAQIGGFGQSSLDCVGVTLLRFVVAQSKNPHRRWLRPGKEVFADSRSGYRLPLSADDTLFRRASS